MKYLMRVIIYKNKELIKIKNSAILILILIRI